MVAGAGTVMMTVLVVGATGNTGKHVVRQLLDQGHSVKVIVRSKQRMLDVLPTAAATAGHISDKQDDDIIKTTTVSPDNLMITEGSILDMDDSVLKEQIQNVDAVVSCLGHTMDFNGIFGYATRRLVTEATKKLTAAMIDVSSTFLSSGEDATNNDHQQHKKKYILMSSDGVLNLDGTDKERSYIEQFLFVLIRNLLPPHADNEEAAATVHRLGKDSGMEWTILRPATLIDGIVNEYILLDDPGSPLFGSGIVKRSNVAKAIVDCITDEETWMKWKFRFPVIHDAETTSSSVTEGAKDL